jgi:hypothetical protein
MRKIIMSKAAIQLRQIVTYGLGPLLLLLLMGDTWLSAAAAVPPPPPSSLNP